MPGKPRRIWLFLDDKEKLDFHRAFFEEATKEIESIQAKLGPLRAEVKECYGSQEMQLRLVVSVASDLSANSDDLVCLFPTDLHAIDDLQQTLFSLPDRQHTGGGRANLVCAVVQQVLPQSLREAGSGSRRIISVGADQVMMGKLQAQQLLQLLRPRPRSRRRIIYISGPGHSSATRLRIAGAVETLLDNHFIVEATHAEWDGHKVSAALADWQMMGGDLKGLDAVAAHNDQIAKAAKAWLAQAGRPDIPVLGMDGTDSFGKPLVDEGTLAATVVQPLGVKEVFAFYVSAILREPATTQSIRLMPTSYPPIEDIHPLS